MLSARWAHRALVGVCVLVAIAVGIYAGWEGWLGPEAHKRIRGIIDPLFAQIPHSEFLERLARVLGAVGTLMTAAFGVYKGIYYADRNLPERLMQLLERTDQRLLGDRQPLLSAVADNRPGSRARASLFYVAPLNRALDAMRFGNYRAAEVSLNEALRELKEQMEVSGRQQRSFEEQKVAAHILRGSIASARAEYDAQDGKSPDHGRKLAEREFSEALQLRPEDLDALELRGRQRQILGNHPGAIADYNALVEAAIRAKAALRAARGYRLAGELKESEGNKAALVQARQCLVDGLSTIAAAGTPDSEVWLEKARILLATARVQQRQGRQFGAKRHLREAIDCCKRAGPPAISVLADAECSLALLPPDKPKSKPTGTPAQPWWKRLFDSEFPKSTLKHALRQRPLLPQLIR